MSSIHTIYSCSVRQNQNPHTGNICVQERYLRWGCPAKAWCTLRYVLHNQYLQFRSVISNFLIVFFVNITGSVILKTETPIVLQRSHLSSIFIRSFVRGCASLIDGVWFGWLDFLTPYTHNSGLQVIQRYRWVTHFTVHRYTHTHTH
jgi:hypothetical protein